MAERGPKRMRVAAEGPAARGQVSAAAFDPAGRLLQGSVTLSLCATVHPLHTRFTNTFGTSISETTMRPNPRLLVTASVTGRTLKVFKLAGGGVGADPSPQLVYALTRGKASPGPHCNLDRT